MGRQRSEGRRDWPAGLHFKASRRRFFIRYTVWEDGVQRRREHWLPAAYSEARAKAYARRWRPPGSAQDPASLAAVAEAYLTRCRERVAHGRMAASTLDERERIVAFYVERVGSRPFASFTRQVLKATWDARWPDIQKGQHARRQHWVTWKELGKQALADGVATVNEAALMQPPIVPVKARRRIKGLDEYHAIREAAPAWFRYWLDVYLYSARRRSELIPVEKAHIDWQACLWRVHLLKKRGASADDPATIDIDFRDTHLEGALRAAMGAGELSPWLLPYTPQRRAKGVRWPRPHRSTLSHAFRDARDATGLWDDVDPAARPTLHEVRSLAGRLLEEAVDEDAAQELYGHATIRMTREYLEDGRVPVVRAW